MKFYIVLHIKMWIMSACEKTKAYVSATLRTCLILVWVLRDHVINLSFRLLYVFPCRYHLIHKRKLTARLQILVGHFRHDCFRQVLARFPSCTGEIRPLLFPLISSQREMIGDGVQAGVLRKRRRQDAQVIKCTSGPFPGC